MEDREYPPPDEEAAPKYEDGAAPADTAAEPDEPPPSYTASVLVTSVAKRFGQQVNKLGGSQRFLTRPKSVVGFEPEADKPAPVVQQPQPAPAEKKEEMSDNEAIGILCGLCCFYGGLIALYAMMIVVGTKYATDPVCGSIGDALFTLGYLNLIFIHLLLVSVCCVQFACFALVEGIVLFVYHIVFSVQLSDIGIGKAQDQCPGQLFYFFRVYQILYFVGISLLCCCCCCGIFFLEDDKPKDQGNAAAPSGAQASVQAAV